MEIDFKDDEDIARVAQTTRVIAVVGMSPNESRASWGVARYLQANGFRVIPVNPGHAGSRILGEPVYASLTDIPKSAGVQMVNVFRRPEAVGPVVDEALKQLPDLQTIWLQLGIRNDAAAEKARQRGVTVIQDRCSKIEFARYI
ncbi:CoA-binding protein [Paracoccus subflavus]|uniref:CoA-binding protein n=1 Tax=Paracoccus subflavus TaxID=2528244 RepID=A0A4Q9G5C5_9RHOB|nr:CoA-binding protein [Paracoccus subflavus]TBN39454.1 CoA-binding protein [Paracoccus subflavus]